LSQSDRQIGRGVQSIAMNEARQELYLLLGDLPDRERAISAHIVDRKATQACRLEKLVLDLNGIEPVPAYFASPFGTKGPLPTIIYNHAPKSRIL
jgi:hypothetical protein